MNSRCRGPAAAGCFVPLGLLLVVGNGGCTPAPAPAPPTVRPVKTMVITEGGGPQVRVFPGKVEASKRVELGFQVSGLLANLPIKEGQRVAKGELIAQLRQDEFAARLKTLQAQLDQARANLQALLAGERAEERLRRESAVRAAEARLANARVEHERNTRLLSSRSITRADYDVTETAFRVAQEDVKSAVQLLEKGTIGREEDIAAQQAEVRGLEGRVVEANLQLQDSTLQAPYDGVISQRFVEAGQSIRAHQPIVKFQDVDEIDIVVDVPETVMTADLRAADIVQMLAEFSAAPGLEFPVHLKEIAQSADPTTQTFQVRVAMQVPADVRLLPGMTATVTVTYHRASILGNRLLVPISAIYKTDGGEQVTWLIGSDQTVSRRRVKLGQAVGGQVEIVDGLAPGDRIAVAGVTFLREGLKVRDLGNSLGSGSGGVLR